MLDLEDIKRRLAERTPGSWHAIKPKNYARGWRVTPTGEDDLGAIAQFFFRPSNYRGDVGGREYPAQANAWFVASAPNDIAALIAEVERLRDALGEIASGTRYDIRGEDADRFWQIANRALEG